MARKTPPESDPVAPAEEDVLDASATDDDQADEEKQPLELEIAVDKRGACQRHVSVSVSRADIDRYLDKEFSTLVKDAEVPGFPPGQ